MGSDIQVLLADVQGFSGFPQIGRLSMDSTAFHVFGHWIVRIVQMITDLVDAHGCA